MVGQYNRQERWLRNKWRLMRRDKFLLLMFLPVMAHYVIFSYLPMYGVTLAFKDYSISKGIMGSPWVGFEHFVEFFQSIYVGRLLRNTLTINLVGLFIGFPIPILFAVALNEIPANPFRKFVQTVSYFPNFISTVILVSLLTTFSNPSNGLFTQLARSLGYEGKYLLSEPALFKFFYIVSGIWQSFGWNSIMYLSAITSIDPSIYEAAIIDGATRRQRALHITLPGIQNTIVLLLLLNTGGMFSIGPEKVMLMYSPALFEVADVISTYVYRAGIESAKFSFSTAVGLFNSFANFLLLVIANRTARKFIGASLW